MKFQRHLQQWWEHFAANMVRPTSEAEADLTRACFFNGANAVLLILQEVRKLEPDLDLPQLIEALQAEVLATAKSRMGIREQ